MGRKMKHENPFVGEELSNVMFAREEDDIEYLKEWTRRAVPVYEAYRNGERERHKKAAKYDKLMSTLAEALDKDDLALFEFGE